MNHVPKISEDDPWSYSFRRRPHVHPHEHLSPLFQQRSGGQAFSIKYPRLYRAKVCDSKPLNSALFPKNRHLTLALESSRLAPHRRFLSLTLTLPPFLQLHSRHVRSYSNHLMKIGFITAQRWMVLSRPLTRMWREFWAKWQRPTRIGTSSCRMLCVPTGHLSGHQQELHLIHWYTGWKSRFPR